MAGRKNKLKQATVVGVFATRSEAEATLRELRAAGFDNDKIGLVARNASGELVDESGETYADEGAVAGVVAGAGVGTLIGLGVLSGVIPVVGPAIFAGTIGTILTNAVGGAAVVGVAGALVGWGVSQSDAEFFEAEVKAGRFLVTVDADDRGEAAWAILHRHGGYNQTRAAATLSESERHSTKPVARTRKATVKKTTTVSKRGVTVAVAEQEVVIDRRPANRKK